MCSRDEAEKEAERIAVVAAAQGHFLDQPDSNFFKADHMLGNEDSDGESSRPKSKKRPKTKGKSKYGYKYDGFIDDSEEMDSDDDWENEAPKPKKKSTKSRPKKIKEEEDKETNVDDDLGTIDQIVKIKEDAIEKAFNEFSEFYSPQTEVIEPLVSFSQDDDGVFHCEASHCIFTTLVRRTGWRAEQYI